MKEPPRWYNITVSEAYSWVKLKLRFWTGFSLTFRASACAMIWSVLSITSPNVSFSRMVPLGIFKSLKSSSQWSGDNASPRTYFRRGTIFWNSREDKQQLSSTKKQYMKQVLYHNKPWRVQPMKILESCCILDRIPRVIFHFVLVSNFRTSWRKESGLTFKRNAFRIYSRQSQIALEIFRML